MENRQLAYAKGQRLNIWDDASIENMTHIEKILHKVANSIKGIILSIDAKSIGYMPSYDAQYDKDKFIWLNPRYQSDGGYGQKYVDIKKLYRDIDTWAHELMGLCSEFADIKSDMREFCFGKSTGQNIDDSHKKKMKEFVAEQKQAQQDIDSLLREKAEINQEIKALEDRLEFLGLQNQEIKCHRCELTQDYLSEIKPRRAIMEELGQELDDCHGDVLALEQWENCVNDEAKKRVKRFEDQLAEIMRDFEGLKKLGDEINGLYNIRFNSSVIRKTEVEHPEPPPELQGKLPELPRQNGAADYSTTGDKPGSGEANRPKMVDASVQADLPGLSPQEKPKMAEASTQTELSEDELNKELTKLNGLKKKNKNLTAEVAKLKSSIEERDKDINEFKDALLDLRSECTSFKDIMRKIRMHYFVLEKLSNSYYILVNVVARDISDKKSVEHLGPFYNLYETSRKCIESIQAIISANHL